MYSPSREWFGELSDLTYAYIDAKDVKNYTESDRLRKLLVSRGVIDLDDGPHWLAVAESKESRCERLNVLKSL